MSTSIYATEYGKEPSLQALVNQTHVSSLYILIKCIGKLMKLFCLISKNLTLAVTALR